MFLLVTVFLAIAAVYASVGFGGGSSYTAVLMIIDTDFRLVPVISLICNLIVVSGGTIHFARAGLLRANIVLPFTVLSVPMAWLGGITPIDRNSFTLVLALVLLASAVAMFVDRPVNQVNQVNQVETPIVSTKRLWTFGLVAGGALGFIAGLVGIGGGIFLAPTLHLMRLAPARTIAAAASLFILVNSCAGLIGQWSKLGALEIRGDLHAYLWLFPAVLIGGQLGSRVGIRIFSPRTVRRLTAALVFIVGGRLLFRWYTTG
jgi:uncharacterized membrane protein YfcA